VFSVQTVEIYTASEQSPPGRGEVGCLNNDRTVMGRSFALRPLARLPILRGLHVLTPTLIWSGRDCVGSLYAKGQWTLLWRMSMRCAQWILGTIDLQTRWSESVRLGPPILHLLTQYGWSWNCCCNSVWSLYRQLPNLWVSQGRAGQHLGNIRKKEDQRGEKSGWGWTCPTAECRWICQGQQEICGEGTLCNNLHHDTYQYIYY